MSRAAQVPASRPSPASRVGAALDGDQDTWVRVVGGVLAVAGALALVEVALRSSRARAAVTGVGLLDAAAAVTSPVSGEEGGVVGLVVGGVTVLLATLAGPVLRKDAVPVG